MTQSPNPESPANPDADTELSSITKEEERCLARLVEHLRTRVQAAQAPVVDYDKEMVALRDEISQARMEDVPPLIEQMERLQALAARRREKTDGFVDPRSPYFGRMVLEEDGRRREVLIGRSTYLNTNGGIRIVDWRDAPVSRLFYRYDEGEEYDEVFGDREVNGTMLVRRSISIVGGEITRIVAPQGTFVRSKNGSWRRLDSARARLSGGQGIAVRADRHQRPSSLGVGEDVTGSEDKHLREITALIDRRQFELITQPDSGLVVIQGGAGSGKTTIGLHRLAYLAFQDSRRFRPDRMLVVVFNEALARYVSQVLPALGLEGVAIRTYDDWAARLRATHLPYLPRRYNEETPSHITKLKKHPAMLRAIDAKVESEAAKILERIELACLKDTEERADGLRRAWEGTAARPLVHRLHSLDRWLEGPGRRLSTDARVMVQGAVRDGMTRAKDVITIWAELLTDREALGKIFDRHAAGAFSHTVLDRVHKYCSSACSLAMLEAEENAEAATGDRPRPGRRRSPHDDRDSDDSYDAIDGQAVDEGALLDHEDDTLLLRLYQKLRGPLRRGQQSKEALAYEHVLIDEAQDLSPVETAVALDTVSRGRSVTLAGDVAQRLHMDNGFTGWHDLFAELDLSHVEVEPLQISYRSTQEIVSFAQHVLGPLAPDDPPVATRSGAPVEYFEFAQSGDAVATLGEALRDLSLREPRASVAVIARFPEQADLYYQGLKQAEIPYLRRITEQEFPFKPGVDVTDARQVKGLEFDYVVLVEVTEATYPSDDESRHLLHIAATRAAHQLWVSGWGRPSPLLPQELFDDGTE